MGFKLTRYLEAIKFVTYGLDLSNLLEDTRAYAIIWDLYGHILEDKGIS